MIFHCDVIYSCVSTLYFTLWCYTFIVTSYIGILLWTFQHTRDLECWYLGVKASFELNPVTECKQGTCLNLLSINQLNISYAMKPHLWCHVTKVSPHLRYSCDKGGTTLGMSCDTGGTTLGMSCDKGGTTLVMSCDKGCITLVMSCDKGGTTFVMSCDKGGTSLLMSCDKGGTLTCDVIWSH